MHSRAQFCRYPLRRHIDSDRNLGHQYRNVRVSDHLPVAGQHVSGTRDRAPGSCSRG
jgi:hypothetical protein